MIILFFLAGLIIIAIGNLVLGPIFNKKIPMNVRFRAFMIGSTIYLITAYLCYILVLKGKL
ncbi:hypothetical protein [Staphylococcus carnosus]|uniref:hypothetical protein n=1 Tax=Staphylococcus carnosus TaxID=1281 RepID=UPI000CD28C4F|nr:hypothetical protein [Staphylococcus carnosus]POA02200.1 hypothetical protein CD153_06700 [Staphylococcus carnosus]QRQ04514.1 hypothetical protein I6J34_09640 [Staphylococcus carnosus]UTB83492.1 hypothetical protein A2I67_09445 [Staphylococcus carnosus]SUM05360.1 membrane protein [Staphylococcus carnosus]GEP79338.1 hypothetical protein SCA05_11310 [Staphylococcus carnosus]